MTIALVVPPSAFLLDERVFLTLGILKVAAVLEQAGHRVEVLDLSGVENFEEAARAFAETTDATAIGITGTTPQMPAVTRIVRVLRETYPGARIILGGPHVTLVNAAYRKEKKRGVKGRATFALETCMGLADVVVCGDGEAAIFPALETSASRLIDADDAGAAGARLIDADDPTGPLFLAPADLDELPFPARHLVDVESYHYSIDGHRATPIVCQLGCPFGCGFCLSGDTVVFTDDGPAAIADLASGVGALKACAHGSAVAVEYRVGREVATPEGRSQATRAMANGVRGVLRIAVEGGLSIKATYDHQLLCAVDDTVTWKRAGDLGPGDVMVVRSPERQWPSEYLPLTAPICRDIPPGGFQRRGHHRAPAVLDENLAWLAGFIVGDGSIPTDGRPSFHVCVTPGVEARLAEIVRTYFNVDLAVSAASNTVKMKHGWVHSRLAREILVQSIGIDPFDKHKIPLSLWRSPKTVLAAFIDGLFAADAYEPPTGPSYLVTASERLARDVSYALLMLGRGCPTITEVENASGYAGARGKKHKSYRVGILRNDRIPTARALYRSSKSGLWYWRTKRGKIHKGIRRRTLRESGLHHPLDREGWFYAQVTSVVEGLPEPVYDITVPAEEAFVANGFVAHNCGGRSSPFLRRARMRSTESVIAELRHVHEAYGFTGFMLFDDELNVNRQMVELMRAIAALQGELRTEFRLRGFVKAELFTDEQAASMYAAGFRWLLCGYESGSPRILRNINKKATRDENTRCVEIARRHGLKVKALMSLGHPGESPETIEDTRRWLLETAPDDFDATIITTYPGTPYYDDAVYGPEGWTFTTHGDRLHAEDVDFTRVAEYYKGGGDGAYRSFVHTDALSAADIVTLRDQLESDVRARLGIPFNQSRPALHFEHSMGQGLPPSILRRSA